MIVVVASRWDRGAQDFSSRWATYNVRLMTSQDLSTAGWRQGLSAGDGWTAVVKGALVPQEEIAGVLTRRACIFPEELADITPDDRPYIASEMTAFLLFWLSRLKCPVLNRPTPAWLSGPYWRHESWVRAATQAGIPVQPVHRRAALHGSCPTEETDQCRATVTVVGQSVFGDADKVLQSQARRLADLAAVDLVSFRFSGPESGACFVSADVFPDLTDERVAGAVLEYFELGRERCT